MAVSSEPTQADVRLGRAGELAAYLQKNPRELRRDPEELSRQFGVDPAVVTQIQISCRASTRKKSAGVDWKRIYRDSSIALTKGLAGPPSRPVPFLLVAGLITLGLVLVPGLSTDWAVRVGIVAEAWCLIAQPRFRNVLVGSMIVWAIAWCGSYKAIGTMKPGNIDLIGGPAILSALMGFGIAFMNLLVGGLVLVIVGWARIAIRRRMDAGRSRQDLLTRMFYLQERLETLPPKVEKPIRPWIVYFRSHLLLCTAITVFALTIARDLATIAFHVDPTVLEGTPKTVATTGSTNIQVARPNVSVAYVMIEGLLSVFRIAAEVVIGLFSTTRKRLGLACLGVAAGEVLAQAITWPFGAQGHTPIVFAPLVIGSVVLDSCLVLLIVRFGVGFNRVLARARGDVMDEAAIVSELLEIRHQLSAITVQVYVLVVDAAGSTQMKRGADRLEVEYSFGRYQAWIGETVSANGGKVDIRTGDGAICAFGDVRQALEAARQLQSGIGAFNAEVNQLALPFRLRIALHAGRVEAELDKVQFTEVIDVTAHVEKYSPVGGIAMTETFLAAANLTDRAFPSELASSATVDGLEVFTLPAN